MQCDPEPTGAGSSELPSYNTGAAHLSSSSQSPTSTFLESVPLLRGELLLPAEELQQLLQQERAKGKGGRQPAADPRLDPSIDAKKAKRILANRQSAARSKQKQRVAMDRLRAQQTLLKYQKGAVARELGQLSVMCRQLEDDNGCLLTKIQALNNQYRIQNMLSFKLNEQRAELLCALAPPPPGGTSPLLLDASPASAAPSTAAHPDAPLCGPFGPPQWLSEQGTEAHTHGPHPVQLPLPVRAPGHAPWLVQLATYPLTCEAPFNTSASMPTPLRLAAPPIPYAVLGATMPCCTPSLLLAVQAHGSSLAAMANPPWVSAAPPAGPGGVLPVQQLAVLMPVYSAASSGTCAAHALPFKTEDCTAASVGPQDHMLPSPAMDDLAQPSLAAVLVALPAPGSEPGQLHPPAAAPFFNKPGSTPLLAAAALPAEEYSDAALLAAAAVPCGEVGRAPKLAAAAGEVLTDLPAPASAAGADPCSPHTPSYGGGLPAPRPDPCAPPAPSCRGGIAAGPGAEGDALVAALTPNPAAVVAGQHTCSGSMPPVVAQRRALGCA